MSNILEHFSISELWGLIEDTLEDLCSAWNSKKLVPLLESDIVAYFYHLVACRTEGDVSWLHVETRMLNDGKRKPDLVIGPSRSTQQQKGFFLETANEEVPDNIKRILRLRHTNRYFLPAIDAKIILEFKLFRTPPKIKSILRDTIKLSCLKQDCPEGRASILFVDDGFQFNYEKCEMKIRTARGFDDPNLRIYICKKGKDGQPWMRV